MHSFKTPLFVLIAFFVAMTQVRAENVWKLIKEEDSIQVHVRDTPASAVKSFKGSMTITSLLSALVAVIEDSQSYPRWLHNCKRANTLKKVGENQVFNYVVTGMPWPVADRDAIVHSTLTQNKSSKQVLIKLGAAPNLVPQQRGIVRMYTLNGSWKLTPLGKGLVNVVYEINVDPGGNIPKWLVNAMAVDLPFYTLQKLKGIIKEAKYRNARFVNIIE